MSSLCDCQDQLQKKRQNHCFIQETYAFLDFRTSEIKGSPLWNSTGNPENPCPQLAFLHTSPEISRFSCPQLCPQLVFLHASNEISIFSCPQLCPQLAFLHTSTEISRFSCPQLCPQLWYGSENCCKTKCDHSQSPQMRGVCGEVVGRFQMSRIRLVESPLQPQGVATVAQLKRLQRSRMQMARHYVLLLSSEFQTL